MANRQSETIKTTILLEKNLLEEVDRLNPFPTRKAFLDRACKAYLLELRRKQIDKELEDACAEATGEDLAVHEEWQSVTMETWK